MSYWLGLVVFSFPTTVFKNSILNSVFIRAEAYPVSNLIISFLHIPFPLLLTPQAFSASRVPFPVEISAVLRSRTEITLLGCQDWWAAGCRQNTSAPPANCTVCSAVKSLQILTDLGELAKKFQRHQPFLIKTGQHFSSEELKHFQSQDPELAEVITEDNSAELWSCPFGWNKSLILQEFLPESSWQSFPKTVSLESCFLIHHPDLGNKSYSLHSLFAVGSGQLTLSVAPLDTCRGHCETFKVELEAGDLGYVSTDYWTMSFMAKGTEPAVVCDGTAS
ncbi:bombesin receptor-activated protein C6orf89 homolog isoform X3 [Pithys albifrons albifrons]|uniref:bombesin receptor-activated protein C6orf89 homolog isoform X3 n=1 Tax=Pithys albifrons albifrons TaxID=3385563 RepID=UPI003A5CD72A